MTKHFVGIAGNIGVGKSTYIELYHAVTAILQPPNLALCLEASPMERIRHRTYELDMSESYLAQLNQRYNDGVNTFSLCPVLTIPADRLDFVAHREHLNLIIEKVMERLHGKEVVTFEQS